MKTLKKLFSILVFFALISNAYSTNGILTHGFGTTAKGLGGAGTAKPMTALSGIQNPASLYLLGEKRDMGFSIIKPARTYKISGDSSATVVNKVAQKVAATALAKQGIDITTLDSATAAQYISSTIQSIYSQEKASNTHIFPGIIPLSVGDQDNTEDYHFIPHVGVNYVLDKNSTAGFAFYTNGISANYNTATFANLYHGLTSEISGSNTTGISLKHIFFDINYARKINEKHFVGLSLITLFQRLELEGLQAFSNRSQDKSKLTNNDYDSSFGVGLRLGYLAKINEQLNAGISYQTKVNASEFKEYKGVVAEDGNFDFPAILNLGAAYKVKKDMELVFDIQHTFYKDVNVLSNPFIDTALLGTEKSPGLGWDNMTVYKLGFEHDYNKDYSYRLGFSHGKQPVGGDDVFFNLLGTGVTETHLTAGLTKTLKDNRKVTFSLMHALKNSISGPNPLAGDLQDIELEMSQTEFAVEYSF